MYKVQGGCDKVDEEKDSSSWGISIRVGAIVTNSTNFSTFNILSFTLEGISLL